MDTIDLISGVLLLVLAIWGGGYVYSEAKRRWTIPEEKPVAYVLFFAFLCAIFVGIIVLLSLLVKFGMFPDFRIWPLEWI